LVTATKAALTGPARDRERRRILKGMSNPLDPAMFTECRSADLPMRLKNKWAPKIMRCLVDGPRRYSELQVPLVGISPKVLAESLRSMERDGLVSRTAHPGMPPKVEYELTALGLSLLKSMESWCDWADEHLEELLEARQAYEGRA
jgi:DNA-binding HxlR family transcriptional regulator